MLFSKFLMVVFCGFSFGYTNALFYVEFEEVNEKGKNTLWLYECKKKFPRRLNSVKEGNPHAIHDLWAIDGIGDASWWKQVACERHSEKLRIRNIYKTVNFYSVRVDLDPVSLPHASHSQLPHMVRIGIPFQPLDYPPFEEGAEEIQYYDAKVNDLCEKKVLDECSQKNLVNFLSITNLHSVMGPDMTVLARLAAFVSSMNKVTNSMYQDFQRSFFENFLRYRGYHQVQSKASAERRVLVKEGVDTLLPEMLDPCFIISYQKETEDTAEVVRKLADSYCTSYCKFLAATSRLINRGTRYLCDRLLWGKCREDKRNVCYCVRAPYLLSFWSIREYVSERRWIPGSVFLRMAVCNNSLRIHKFL